MQLYFSLSNLFVRFLFRLKLLQILTILLFFSVAVQGQVSVVTAAGTATWTLNGTTSITEVTLNRSGTLHNDGFDGALLVNVTGTNISFTNSYHLSSTYGAAVQHIAVTNNGGTPSAFTLSSTGNLGSDANTRWHYASTSGGRYTISSDNASASSNGTDPVISLIYGNAALNGLTTSMSYSNGNDNASFTVSNVPIAAGQTRRFLIVVGVGNIDNSTSNMPSQAYVAVQNLVTGLWPADFTNFLTNAQKAEVMNWSALTVLPVTWAGFSAKPYDNNVKLEWKTASESNTKDFVVQHSVDGRIWSDIGTVIAAGHSTNEKTYTHWHNQPLPGTNHYRVQQNDADGRYSFSKILKVVMEQKPGSWELRQNPVISGFIGLQLPTKMEMKLYNNSGAVMWKGIMAEGFQQISISHLPKGVYFLEGGKQTKRVVLQ